MGAEISCDIADPAVPSLVGIFLKQNQRNELVGPQIDSLRHAALLGTGDQIPQSFDGLIDFRSSFERHSRQVQRDAVGKKLRNQFRRVLEVERVAMSADCE